MIDDLISTVNSNKSRSVSIGNSSVRCVTESGSEYMYPMTQCMGQDELHDIIVNFEYLNVPPRSTENRMGN